MGLQTFAKDRFKIHIRVMTDNTTAISAFSLDWSTLNFYAFPPFSVILPMLNKIQMDKARGVCVVPDWPTQGWYPLMMQMQEREPIRLKVKEGLLTLPVIQWSNIHYIRNCICWLFSYLGEAKKRWCFSRND